VSVAGVFARCRADGRAALIPYLMAGDPSLAMTPALLAAAVAGGADIIEIGIPYSDPLADGPTIQAAAQRALHAGTTFDSVLNMVAGLDRSIVPVPLIAFTYYNPIFVRGIERTARDFAHAGFAGAIIPDLPPQEAAPLQTAFDSAGLGLTFLVAPTTPIERVREIAKRSSAFVYVVSRMGVTGASRALGSNIRDLVDRLRPEIDKPLAVGFGISTPEHARAIAMFADGVVVGSALIDRIATSSGDETTAVRTYCSAIAASIRR
jgi:tryptophan synthase alpha chain